MAEIWKKINLEVTTFKKKNSAKCTNFEVSVLNFKSRVSGFLMKSLSRSFNQISVSKVAVSTISLPTRLCTFILDTDTHPFGMIFPRTTCGPAEPPSHWYRTFPLLLVQMGNGILCDLWVWRWRTNRRPCCPPTSNPSASSWTARPDGSGRWDNGMAAQHLTRDLVRPSSGLKNCLKRSGTANSFNIRQLYYCSITWKIQVEVTCIFCAL